MSPLLTDNLEIDGAAVKRLAGKSLPRLRRHFAQQPADLQPSYLDLLALALRSARLAAENDLKQARYWADTAARRADVEHAIAKINDPSLCPAQYSDRVPGGAENRAQQLAYLHGERARLSALSTSHQKAA